MDFNTGTVNLDLNENKDLIIKVLGKKSPLSAKKIHKKLQEKFFTNLSYQAVHKILKSLLNTEVIKKFENEYYLNQEWVDYLFKFAQSLKNKEEFLLTKGKENTSGTDYNQKLRVRAIRFTPFYLGSFPKNKTLLESFKTIKKTKKEIVFEWEGNLYTWYDAGICIQIIKEKEKSSQIVDLLLERRQVHNKILNYQNEYVEDILKIVKLINPKIKLKLSYVMSIYYVDFDKEPPRPHSNNLLKLITLPGLLGITDDPKTIIGNKQIESAKRKLLTFSGETIESSEIYDMSLDKTKKVFASWSNVVFCCPEEDKENLTNTLIEMETKLQHLWFYFHTLKKEIRRLTRNNKLENFKKIKTKALQSRELWADFDSVDPLSDTHYHLIKEGLLKTSKIEKLYQELNNTFLTGKLKVEN